MRDDDRLDRDRRLGARTAGRAATPRIVQERRNGERRNVEGLGGRRSLRSTLPTPPGCRLVARMGSAGE